MTGPTTHRPFDHYRAAMTNQLWTLADDPPASHNDSLRRFMIDPLRAPTTSELGVVFVTPALRPGKGDPTYLAINVRPQSVVDPLVPPGYGFAIIAPTGKVLFHSEEGLSLQENFFEEVGNPGEVRDKARSHRVVKWSGDYHGRPHRLRLQPIEAFRDCPWLIVTFQEVTPVLSRELIQQTDTLRLGSLNLVLLVGLALGFAARYRYRHRRVRDLMQTILSETTADSRWIKTLIGLAVLEFVMIVVTYLPVPPMLLNLVYLENLNAAVDSSDGSGLVRLLLDLNVFSSSDEPIDHAAQRSISSHVLSVGPLEHWRGGPVEGLSGVSGIGIVIGMSILGASMAGIYWVRGKLRSSGSAAAPSLEETIRNTPKTGHVVALLIGPARAAKDAEVCRVVKDVTQCEPIDRIRLLDPKATVNKEYLDSEVNRVTQTIKWRARIGTLPSPFWVHVSNLEAQLVDEESRTGILNVLDRLLNAVPEHRGCLVVTSTIDPIEHFNEIFLKERKGIYTTPVPDVALNRSVLILSFFRRCYMPISPRVGSVERCKDAWDSWWHYSPKDWRVTLAKETDEVAALDQVREELMSAWWNREEVPFAELVRTIRARAMAYYQLVWTSCTRSEKLVLIQLAQEGFVTTQSTDVVAPLIAKGIIVERPTPAIFNLTFRDFLIDIERDDVIERWERGEGHGLWVVSGRLIGSSLIVGVLFFLLTQDVSVQSLLPVLSGTGLFSIPAVRAVLARLSGKAADTA